MFNSTGKFNSYSNLYCNSILWSTEYIYNAGIIVYSELRLNKH